LCGLCPSFSRRHTARNFGIRFSQLHECCIERLRVESTYVTVYHPNLIRQYSLTGWIEGAAHSAWQTVDHKSRIYSLLRRNARHFQYNAVAIQLQRRHSARRVQVRVRVFAVDIRIYNESRYRLTNAINMINILLDTVFTVCAQAEWTFYLVLFANVVNRWFSRLHYIYVRYHKFSFAHS